MDENEKTQQDVNSKPAGASIVLEDHPPSLDRIIILVVIALLLVAFFIGSLIYVIFYQPSMDALDILKVKDEDLRPSSQSFVTRKLAKIPYNYNVYPLLFSPDGKNFAYRMSGEWRIPFVVINGTREESDAFGLTMSQDGEQFAFVGRDARGFRVIRRGGSSNDVLENPFPLSEDRSYEFLEKSPTLNKDSRGYFDEIDDVSLAFSQDGKHLVYFARDYNSKKSFLVVDDQVYEALGDIERNNFAPYSLPTFSPDGRSLAYIASKTDVTWERLIGTPIDKQEFVVVNNKIVGVYDEIVSPLAYSSDGKQLAYTIKDESGMAVVVNGKKGERYLAIDTHFPPLFSPDGTRLAYFAIRDREDKWTLVVNGQEQRGYDNRPLYSSLVFSPDSQKIAYWAGIGRNNFVQDKKWFVVVNSKESSKYDDVSYDPTLVFSLDSKKLAYQARRDNKSFIVVNDEEGPVYDGVSWPIFSPNSKHIAYPARKNRKWLVIVDGKEGKLYDDIISHPRFTPDSQYVFYGVRVGDELWQIVETVE
ncbi:PD40 domain-containing protein [Candidatus Microgenomates bacterium]|nr:PD40 domain-containing protein [Candidatus Microgenomates bacterium]